MGKYENKGFFLTYLILFTQNIYFISPGNCTFPPVKKINIKDNLISAKACLTFSGKKLILKREGDDF